MTPTELARPGRSSAGRPSRLRTPPVRLLAGATVAGLVAATAIALTGAPAGAAATDVVVSAIYGGGGNAGSTFTNDYIELHNLGSTPVPVGSWSVQYASAAGTTWQVTPLVGTIPPGAFYLVAEGGGGGGTTPLPAPDAPGSIAMSATNGKVALVTSATPLTCGATCASNAAVHDFVGYGTANDAETAAAPALTNTTAGARADGAADTDNNAADFTAGPPNPRSSGGAADPGVPGLRIHDVQGAAHVSPQVGKRVLDVPGVVSAIRANSFWIADPQPDADPATSEGLLVFTGSAPAVAFGDSVTVTGRVTEFRSGGSNLSTTEIASPTVTVVAAGQPVPAATVVGAGGRVPPGRVVENDATGDIETSGVFDPAGDGLDFWESLEGMRVQLDDAAVVGPTNRFAETQVVPRGAGVRTTRGGIVLQAGDDNPERIVVASGPAAAPTDLNVGDTLAGATVGVVDYDFANFELLLTAPPTVTRGGLAREVTRPQRPDELAVATFNVENLDPTDPQDKFDRLASAIVTNLAAPDLVALEEVQDNTGPADDGVVAADATLAKLVAAIGAAGGPAYGWREIDPTNDTDGGEPGGNIRVAFLFRTDRGLSFVDRPGGTATTATGVVVGPDNKPHLTLSPGRLVPGDAAWTTSRKPLAGEFRWKGQTLFVIANHFNSKSGDQPLSGRFQPPARASETQRHTQARLVRSFVDELTAASRFTNIVVLGDLNDFDFSETTRTLTANAGLVDLPATLSLPERYTYVFEGNSQVLDQILLSRWLARSSSPGQSNRYDYDVVHVNSEFADQASDHEPQVVRLRF
jgi:predicted extracellular nuclease